jgi:hypothetical protein
MMKCVAGMSPKPPRLTKRKARAGRYSGELNLVNNKRTLIENKLVKTGATRGFGTN